MGRKEGVVMVGTKKPWCRLESEGGLSKHTLPDRRLLRCRQSLSVTVSMPKGPWQPPVVPRQIRSSAIQPSALPSFGVHNMQLARIPPQPRDSSAQPTQSSHLANLQNIYSRAVQPREVRTSLQPQRRRFFLFTFWPGPEYAQQQHGCFPLSHMVR